MPFVSDKQRKYLWSQKPEVAKQIAYKNEGGPMDRDMNKIKKLTQKDRYGNQMTYEFEVPKPLDETAITKHMMDKATEVPMLDGMDIEMGMDIPYDHPGEPRGSDTVPAWLTPGEFVVNKEATQVFGPQIEAMNDVGRQMQQGGGVSYKQIGGLQESYGSDFQYAPPVDESIKIFDQQWQDEVESGIPNEVKQAAAILNAYEQGVTGNYGNWQYKLTPSEQEASLNYGFRFENGGEVPLPKSYAQALLESREGYRDDVYLDTLGKPTVGHGHLLPEEFKEQVGKKPFTKKELDEFFKMDIETATKAARKNIKNFDKLNKKQQGALISQAFQLGPTGQSKFQNMIDAIENERWDEVGAHAKDSLWAQQTPVRAEDIAQAFMDGGEVQYLNIGDYIKSLWGSGADDDLHTEEEVVPFISGLGEGQPVNRRNPGSIHIPRGDNTQVPYVEGLDDPNYTRDVGVDPGEGAIATNQRGIPTAEGDHIPEDFGIEVPPGYYGIGEEDHTDQAVYNEALSNNELAIQERLVNQKSFDVSQTDKKIAVAEKNLASVDPVKTPKKYNKYHQDLEDLKAEKAGYEAELADATAKVSGNQAIVDSLAERDANTRKIILESKDTLSPAEAAELDGIKQVEAEEEKVAGDLAEDSEVQLVDGQVNSNPEEAAAGAQEAADNMPPEEKEGLLNEAKGLLGKAGEFLGFSSQDLGRLAVYYAAGRLTGGSHGGSLKWAGMQMLNENQARRAAEAKLAVERAKSGGVDISGTPKNFEVNGELVRAVFDKNSGDYIYKGKDGSWQPLPKNARDTNVKFQDTADIQSNFDKDIESTLKVVNKNVADGESGVAVDSRAISAQATNIYQEMQNQFGKTTEGSKDLQRKISEAVREVVKRGGTANELRAEVNKKLIKLKSGISETAFNNTSTENFATLDGLLEQGADDTADYKNDWNEASTAWRKLPKKVKDKWSKEPGWDGFAWFTYQVITGNQDAINDAKGIKS